MDRRLHRRLHHLSSKRPKISDEGVLRATARGYLLERRGPDGRRHLAISAEGWSLPRASEAA